MVDVAEVMSISGKYNVMASARKEPIEVSSARKKYSTFRRVTAAAILIGMNFLNFFDRAVYSVTLPAIQDSFKVNDGSLGLLNTAFVISIIVASPVAGIVGRKYSRKWTIIIGTSGWCAACICGPLFNKGSFTLFLIVRIGAGLGESFLVNLAVTLFHDMFSKQYRPLILNIFFGTVMLGGSVTLLVGPALMEATAGLLDYPGWAWTCATAGILGTFLIIPAAIIVPDIPLTQAKKKFTIMEEVRYLFSCKTWVFIAIGYSLSTFGLGARNFFSVLVLKNASQINDGFNLAQVEGVCGICVLLFGSLGAFGSAELARVIKNKGFRTAQPVVTGFIAIFSGVTFLAYMQTVTRNIYLAMAFFSLSNIPLSSWVGTTQDIIVGVIPPAMGPMGVSLLGLIGHLCGDGFSSLIVGAISAFYQRDLPNTYSSGYESLNFALYLTQILSTIGGAMYVFAALSLPSDLAKMSRYVTSQTHSGPAEEHCTKRKRRSSTIQNERVSYGTLSEKERLTEGQGGPFVPLDRRDGNEDSSTTSDEQHSHSKRN